ncbi:FKBP-type peptidyl-prolyl cis-trans isomerase [Streptomyces sp. NPDC056231]|uniref:FKBP-type peptidyl-prolyl cis-trans isomerase n=1 Tax=Streptomyces sp. NPDC056231 TaxID=3345755 RepID=UPI003AB0FD7E
MNSNADGGPLVVVLDRGNVIKGWEQALAGLRVGSRILVVMPAGLAYGTHPPPGVPAGATVVNVFDVLAIS